MATSHDDFDLVVLLKYPVSSSGVKILGLTLVGYTWQWRCFCVVTLLKALPGFARTDLQGENSGFDLRWFDPMMAALEHRSLPEGVAAGELLSLSL